MPKLICLDSINSDWQSRNKYAHTQPIRQDLEQELYLIPLIGIVIRLVTIRRLLSLIYPFAETGTLCSNFELIVGCGSTVEIILARNQSWRN
jgi:hypothetical protein